MRAGGVTSARNEPNHSLFVASGNHPAQPSATLKAGPLQEIGDQTQNEASVTIGVKRAHAGSNRNSFRKEERLFPGKPNDTIPMKTRPATSFQFKGRQSANTSVNSSLNLNGSNTF